MTHSVLPSTLSALFYYMDTHANVTNGKFKNNKEFFFFLEKQTFYK